MKNASLHLLGRIGGAMLLCCILTPSLLAQSITATLRGQVVDVDTKESVAGASIIVAISPDSVIGTASDVDGWFRLEGVPVGRHNVIIESIGYEERLLANVLLSSGRETSLVVEMQESLDESSVTVTAEIDKSSARNSMATVSARSFTVEETSRYAASFWDPARMAQSYAGVATADDENNHIIVRGNSPRGLLWRLEGAEIPNPNHFRDGPGGSGGGVSMISNTVLADSDFLSGAFPAEYGNALSGVFDLRFRNGNNDRREYTVQVGALGGQLSAEGPFIGENSSYLLNYRYADLSVLDAIGIKFGGENAVAPKFQDVNFLVNVPAPSLGTFRLWGIGGISEAGDEAIRDTNLWDSPSDRYEGVERHTTGVVGLGHLYLFPSGSTYLKTTGNVSYSQSKVDEDTLDRSYVLHPVERREFTDTDLRISTLLNHKFSSRHIAQVGAIYGSLGFDLLERELVGDTFVDMVDDSGRTGLLQAYGNWQFRPSENFTFNTGLHYLHLLLNGSTAIEPRFGAAYKLGQGHTVSYGLGVHSRAEPAALYFARWTDEQGRVSRPNADLGFTRALHNVIAWDWSIASDLRLKAELYHQYLFDLPVGADSSRVSSVNFTSGYTGFPLVNEGTGRNIGLELTFEKFFSRGYYFLLTTSLFDSKYTALDGVERNTFFNGNTIVNLLGGKEFAVGSTGQNVIAFDLRGIWRGGYRMTPIDLEASRVAGRSVFEADRFFAERGPDYYRIDVGLSYRSNHPGWSWTVELDMQNVTNRLNLLREYYDPFTDRIEHTTYSGLIPSVNVSFSF